MKPIRVYRCPDTIDGMLTGIYEAGISRYGHDHIRLEVILPDCVSEMQLFSEYIEITEDAKKAAAAADSIINKISPAIYSNIIHVLLSAVPDKADIAYHFLVYAFHMGPAVMSALQIPWVKQVFEISRAVVNESHSFREFLRFSQTDTFR